jgi:hypothetical protein
MSHHAALRFTIASFREACAELRRAQRRYEIELRWLRHFYPVISEQEPGPIIAELRRRRA